MTEYNKSSNQILFPSEQKPVTSEQPTQSSEKLPNAKTQNTSYSTDPKGKETKLNHPHVDLNAQHKVSDLNNKNQANRENEKVTAKVRPLLLFSAFVIFCFGIFAEAQFTISKTSINPFYTTQTSAKDKARDFVKRANTAMNAWKEYHGSENASLIDPINRQTQAAMILYLEDKNNLTKVWQIHSLYHYAYLKLIQADISPTSQKNNHIENGLQAITEATKLYDNSKFTVKENTWLLNMEVINNLKIIKAMLYAIDVKLSPYDKSKQEIAMKVLHEIGLKSVLKAKDLDKDRLLKPIYLLKYATQS